MLPFTIQLFNFPIQQFQPLDSQIKFNFEFTRIVLDLPVPVVALWHWGVLHLLCSCLCFCHWCVVIIICNRKFFKLLSTLTCLSSPVVRMHICILMKNTGKITSVKHVYFPVVSYFCVPETKGMDTKQLESIYSRYQLTSHWHCLSSFTFTHQQVYLLLLLLSHLNKSIFCYFYFYTEPSLSNWLYQAAEFLQRRGGGVSLLTSCWGLL